MQFQTGEELEEEARVEHEKLRQKALSGKATWGAWRYNPDNLTLEIDSEISGYPKEDPYYVDLKKCNTSFEILDTLCQLLNKTWFPTEQVGYLLKAIDELSGGIQSKVLPGDKDRRFNMGKHLKDMDRQRYIKLLKVEEAAQILRVSRLSIYRMIKDGKIEVIRLPLGKDGEIRIYEDQLSKILGKADSNGEEKS
jgi:excisionase family DNA binding protein